MIDHIQNVPLDVSLITGHWEQPEIANFDFRAIKLCDLCTEFM